MVRAQHLLVRFGDLCGPLWKDEAGLGWLVCQRSFCCRFLGVSDFLLDGARSRACWVDRAVKGHERGSSEGRALRSVAGSRATGRRQGRALPPAPPRHCPLCCSSGPWRCSRQPTGLCYLTQASGSFLPRDKSL